MLLLQSNHSKKHIHYTAYVVVMVKCKCLLNIAMRLDLIDIYCNIKIRNTNKLIIDTISSYYTTFWCLQTNCVLHNITRTSALYASNRNITTPNEKIRWLSVQLENSETDAIWINSVTNNITV